MHHLMRHRGRAVSHRKLLSSIWGVEFRDQVGYSRIYIRQLRRKIDDDPAPPRYILADPYVGYWFREATGRATSNQNSRGTGSEPCDEHEWFGATQGLASRSGRDS